MPLCFRRWRAHVGRLPGPRDLKVIDYLDDNAIRWLSASSLMIAAFGNSDRLSITLGGDQAGFLQVADPQVLRLPAGLLEVLASHASR